MNKTQFEKFQRETEERLNKRAKSNQVHESLPLRVELFLALYEVAWETGCMHNDQPSWRTLIRRISEGKLKVFAPSENFDLDLDNH